MFLVSTLCNNRAEALKILRDVPDNSMIQFPETVQMTSKQIIKYSIEKNLFIIFQSDVKIDDKIYVTFRGVDQGKEVWQVRKFNLWDSDIECGYTPSKPEPFVFIRNHPASLFICYDCAKIYQMKNQLINHNTEILMINGNWQYNFNYVKQVTDFALKYIPTLKYCLFSNTNTLSFIKTKTKVKRITKSGYVELTI
jgi:predicted amidohydrolase